MSSKKILFITPYDFRKPASGGEVRMNALFKAFSKNNELTLVTRGKSNKVHREGDVILSKKGRFSQIFSFKLFRVLKKEIKKSGVEIIFASTIWSGLMAVLLGLFTGKKVVFDDHNIEFIRFLRLKNPIFVLVYLLELIVCARSDRVVFVSEHDAKLARKYLFVRRKKIVVLHNGIHVSDALRQVDFKKEFNLDIAGKKKVLFFGELSYSPNKQAINIIQSEIVPRLKDQSDIVFLVAGRGGGIKSEDNLFYLSFVQEVQNLIHSVDLVIVPLVSGSGTRFKILESAAANTRVLSTKIGAEGIDRSVFGDNLKILPDNEWEEFANRIIELAKKERSKTPQEFFRSYTWDNIIDNDFFSKI